MEGVGLLIGLVSEWLIFFSGVIVTSPDNNFKRGGYNGRTKPKRERMNIEKRLETRVDGINHLFNRNLEMQIAHRLVDRIGEQSYDLDLSGLLRGASRHKLNSQRRSKHRHSIGAR